MDPTGLYRELVIAHNRAPKRFTSIDHPTHRGKCSNPNCGDEIAVQLRIVDGRIVELGFSGEGCAVAIAAASMLGQALADQVIGELAVLRSAFDRLLADGVDDSRLGELRALGGLRSHPARQRCAWIAFEAVQSAFTGATDGTTP